MTESDEKWTLTIVIPAYNEEDAIGSTISRCLDAREMIKREGGVDEVEIIVVSDGSSDRTVEIAKTFSDIGVIVFEHNRGYGAALKEGFAQGKGNLVSFLDADGTCDPRVFAQLCRAVIDQGGDIVLGSRLGPDTKMPAIRKLGNRIFAALLGFLCGQWVTDTGSGMRVMRRSSLERLYPLPDGLHFTPSMSTRALMNGLNVIEVPMPYEERIGTSKLSVIHDGLRFLRVIVEGVLCYRPERLFLFGFTFCAIVSLLLAAYPIEYYVKTWRVEDGMIYRVLIGFLFASVGFLQLCGAALANRMSALRPLRREDQTFWASTVSLMFEGKALAALIGLALVIALWLLGPGLFEYLTTGKVSPTNLHWSRLLVGIFAILSAFQALITGVLLRVLAIWRVQEELRGRRAHPEVDRRRSDDS
ncbi:Undecaprenyl-phosphate 4-deoxy-4-formamido-L-arabinose transferase [Planctomycetes bacterium Pan216]|uniref:Undecaprenyl-phosphate 4-deoxy-4-formamido-L-arabinose transferase n=1 Tax=Kolteria novifilia TaxID=2527975 RepID=A0A518B1J4_9BACT|nr:Undecaprenyl-phosphate 4-deoxy-4-formamido-L-arabinose transferase [Planctomycetes bacterium Pan216]